ncbi:uncharacterized protein [Anabrus simplex]|uniref:uncharacterized protein n=1 Tax=Anabrus simplex TaxID=316456 RepID=UPI0035A3424C
MVAVKVEIDEGVIGENVGDNNHKLSSLQFCTMQRRGKRLVQEELEATRNNDGSNDIMIDNNCIVLPTAYGFSENSRETTEERQEDNEQNYKNDFLHKKNSDKLNKMLRLHGKKYQGKKFQDNMYLVVERAERKLLPVTCSHKEGKKSNARSYRCREIGENQRTKIHKTIWGFNSWDQKRAYVRGLVIYRKVLRRRNKNIDVPKKEYGYDCYLPTEDGRKVRVCKNFLLATTGLKKDSFDDWVKPFYSNSEKEESTENVERGFTQDSDKIGSEKFKSDLVRQ